MRLWRNFLNKFKYIDYINETLFNDLKNNERDLSIFSEFGFKNIIISIFDENINENKLNNINKLSNENIDYCLQINNDKINEIYTIIKKYKSKIPYISLKSNIDVALLININFTSYFLRISIILITLDIYLHLL